MKTTKIYNGTYRTELNGTTYEIDKNEWGWNVSMVSINGYNVEETEWCNTFDTKKECLNWLQENK